MAAAGFTSLEAGVITISVAVMALATLLSGFGGWRRTPPG